MKTHAANQTAYVSFVHGFHDHIQAPPKSAAPALWRVSGDQQRVYKYLFVFEPAEYEALPYTLLGEPPRSCGRLEKRPRYGFTGLKRVGGYFYAGSWNAIYKIDAQNMKVHSCITNRYTCYLHRFYVDQELIIIAMPFKDMVVIMNHQGEILDQFCIDRRLRRLRCSGNGQIDYRLVSKPWSGSTGYFHFNHVQKIGSRLYLTSRNLSAFVVVDLDGGACELRTMNHKTPVCIHDGDYVEGKFYFTSIDGKILIAQEPADFDRELFHYDLQVAHFRLAAQELNWCRGLAVSNGHIFVTVDGRYGSDLSFSLLELDDQCNVLRRERFYWARVGEESSIRFVTGFDIVVEE